jgi:hypothetical protein
MYTHRCYTRHAIAFPGLHRTPARYSGYYTSLRIPSPVPPDDDGAVMLNAAGVLADTIYLYLYICIYISISLGDAQRRRRARGYHISISIHLYLYQYTSR